MGEGSTMTVTDAERTRLAREAREIAASIVEELRGTLDHVAALLRGSGSESPDPIPASKLKLTREGDGSPPVILSATQTKQLTRITADAPKPAPKRSRRRPAKQRSSTSA